MKWFDQYDNENTTIFYPIFNRTTIFCMDVKKSQYYDEIYTWVGCCMHFFLVVSGWMGFCGTKSTLPLAVLRTLHNFYTEKN